MAKTAKEQREEMKTIDARLDKQDKVLDEILLCLKGSKKLNIEGVIPVQKRLHKEIHELTEWKDTIHKYMDVLSSKAFMLFCIGILLAFVGMFLYLKFGWVAIWKYLTWLFS